MPNRKPIDTFYKANDSRFDVIEKSPKCMTNVKKVTGVFFSGYDKRGPLFPETDIATFYDSNKEATMKGLKAGALPWKKMTKRWPFYRFIIVLKVYDFFKLMKNIIQERMTKL